MQVIVATVSQKLKETACYSVVLPTTTGQIEVLPGHTALLTQLKAGEMRIKQAENDAGEKLPITSGFAQIVNDTVYVLA